MRVSHNTQSMAILSIFFTILLFFSLPLLTTTQSLADDRSALLSLRSAVKGRTLLWNTTQSSPCSWPGVTCDDGDRVTVLRLPGVSLSGNIPEGIFGNLTNLRTLSLRLNALKGSLPSDLSLCSDLRHVYLQGNRFSGEIPQILFTLENLRRLSLADNDFSGEISSDFKNLTRLKTLFLQNNKLSGSIPDLDLPLIQFNVSNNSKLNGSIPKNLQRFDSDSFLQTSLCGEPLQICDAGEATVPSQPTSGGNKPPPIINQKKKKISGGVIAGIAIGSVIGFFALILLILLLLCRRKNKEKSREISVEKTAEEEESDGNANANVYSVSAAAAAAMTGNAKPKERNGGTVAVSSKKLTFFGNATANTKVFDLEDLLRASAEVLGKGAFGTAYKAVVDAVTIVAVKRLKEFVKMEEKEFREKIEFVGRMDSHENLVTLRAYYLSRDEKLLVYDYFPMGSLSALLHGGNRGSLNLDARTRIALGAARGLDYLHSQGTATSHGNFKSSNILLTKSRDAKVSDFGLANLVGSSSPHSTTNPNRVTGYLAPEVTDPKRVSKKGDVYSFGVVLLELITGKAPTNSVMNEEGVDLVRWVRSVARDEWRREVYDAEIVTTTTEEEEEVVAEMVELGIECTAQHPDKRPEMVGVVKKIEVLRRCFFGSGSDHVEEAD